MNTTKLYYLYNFFFFKTLLNFKFKSFICHIFIEVQNMANPIFLVETMNVLVTEFFL